ncbi:TonB-dependent receptor plug domain-containing protein [Kaistella sp.]|uniref:TonB-dependent receptor plug domain-containing protein n=1 Tax=Kaistella sp. TaxID=2782235 RepID=UPI003C6692F9
MTKPLLFILSLSFSTAFAQENKSADSLSTKDIQEVLIKSQRKKQFADKSVYTFDKDALEKARFAKDLLTTLPELQLDPISNTVTSTKGGKILFLINGIEASDLQMKSISPENVLRVEYFDIPPARFATRADMVVNVITKNPENGYRFGADASTAFTTGFLNGSAYGNYTKGKNDFGIEYNIYLRNYDNRIVKKTYEYDLNNEHYKSDEKQKDHFGYTDQYITARFTNTEIDKYAFQAKLTMNISDSFSNGIGESNFTQGTLQNIHGTVHNRASDYVNPTLDLYYSKNLSKKDELSLNLVGSFYDTNSTQFDREWILSNNQDVFNNDMILKAKQNGFIGELAHSHQFEKGKLSSGYRISNNSISNDLQNLTGKSNYTVNYLEQYLYTEYSGKKDKLTYRLGMGLTNIHNKSAETTFDEWALTPKVVLGYELKNNQSLRFTSSYVPKSPSSDALSSNMVQVVPNIVRTGNPFLKSQHSWGNNLIYSFNSKYFDLNANAFYWLRNRASNQYYVLNADSSGYLLTYENAKNAQQYGLQLTGSVKPFGNNLLVAKLVFAPASETLKTNDGTLIKNNYIGNYFSFSSEYKNLNIQYQFNVPYYTLNGAFLSTNENASHFFASYKKESWTFTTGIYWIGMPSEYKTKSLPESLVNYTANTQIFNNKNMFVLGLSYDFSTGKKIDIQKKLNNSTAPASTF